MSNLAITLRDAYFPAMPPDTIFFNGKDKEWPKTSLQHGKNDVNQTPDQMWHATEPPR